MTSMFNIIQLEGFEGRTQTFTMHQLQLSQVLQWLEEQRGSELQNVLHTVIGLLVSPGGATKEWGIILGQIVL